MSVSWELENPRLQLPGTPRRTKARTGLAEKPATNRAPKVVMIMTTGIQIDDTIAYEVEWVRVRASTDDLELFRLPDGTTVHSVLLTTGDRPAHLYRLVDPSGASLGESTTLGQIVDLLGRHEQTRASW